jgi:hypothetical protein
MWLRKEGEETCDEKENTFCLDISRIFTTRALTWLLYVMDEN